MCASYICVVINPQKPLIQFPHSAAVNLVTSEGFLPGQVRRCLFLLLLNTCLWTGVFLKRAFILLFQLICLFCGWVAQHVGILVPQPGIERQPPSLEVWLPVKVSTCRWDSLFNSNRFGSLWWHLGISLMKHSRKGGRFREDLFLHLPITVLGLLSLAVKVAS